jgi:PEP-CTERM motif
VVGFSLIDGVYYATEWSDGSVINLGRLGVLSGSRVSNPVDVNFAGQAVGSSTFVIPEPSTWAMMLIGFAGLGYGGYRRARAPRAA